MGGRVRTDHVDAECVFWEERIYSRRLLERTSGVVVQSRDSESKQEVAAFHGDLHAMSPCRLFKHQKPKPLVHTAQTQLNRR